MTATRSSRTVLPPELEAKERLVLDSQHRTACARFAARWPVEVHLAPRREAPDLPSLSGDERDDLAAVHLVLMPGLDRSYAAKDGRPIRLPFIAGWHQTPASVGGWVNDMPPEQIAARLREVAA